jgi:serine/threonine-protein kinase
MTIARALGPVSCSVVFLAFVTWAAWGCSSHSAAHGDDGGTPQQLDGAIPSDGAVSDGAGAPQDSGMMQQLGPDQFLANAPWYQDISQAATASYSQTVIDHLGSAGWGTLRVDVSFAILHADANLAPRTYTTNGAYYTPDCDHAPVPVPPGGAVENYPLNGYTCGGGDCHLLVYQGTRLYELSVADITGGQATGGTFTGGCLAIWDLQHDYWSGTPYGRGEECTSADAAGFPMAPLLLTAADLASGKIKHALRFTLPNSLIRDRSYVHPATHSTSSPNGASGGADTMPYGSRLRLKPGAYSGLNAQAQMVVEALQTYGMFMADGGDLFISGTADLIGVIGGSAVSSLQASDFEVVDSGAPLTWNGNCNRTPLTN